MKRIELVLFFICVFGLSLTLETSDAKNEQPLETANKPAEPHQRALHTITTASAGAPQERQLFFNPYFMHSAYNSMMLNSMGMGMNPYMFSPFSMYGMAGMMNPMYSMMMMNPMYSMMMMNPMMFGPMGMMGMYNPMMMAMMGGWGNRNNNNNNGGTQKQMRKLFLNSAQPQGPI